MKRKFAIVFTLLSGLWLALHLSTGTASDHGKALELREAGEILPLEVIINKAKAVQAGQMLEAELEKEDGRLVYEIELLGDDNQYYELYLDAKTGELLKHERE